MQLALNISRSDFLGGFNGCLLNAPSSTFKRFSLLSTLFITPFSISDQIIFEEGTIELFLDEGDLDESDNDKPVQRVTLGQTNVDEDDL